MKHFKIETFLNTFSDNFNRLSASTSKSILLALLESVSTNQRIRTLPHFLIRTFREIMNYGKRFFQYESSNNSFGYGTIVSGLLDQWKKIYSITYWIPYFYFFQYYFFHSIIHKTQLFTVTLSIWIDETHKMPIFLLDFSHKRYIISWTLLPSTGHRNLCPSSANR